jgi:hypothetical protein
MARIGVALVARNEDNGVKFSLTDDDSRIRAYVEKANGVYAVRDSYDEPVHVGSALYRSALAAVRHYEEWSEAHG